MSKRFVEKKCYIVNERREEIDGNDKR